MPSTLDPIALAHEFRISMPASYRRTHGLDAIQEHAAIVARRGSAIAHVELWRIRRGAVVVVVTDERSEALAMMSAAIACAGFDIVVAEAYRRARGTRPAESVALFELQRPNSDDGPITASDVVPIARALESMIEGHVGADSLLKRNARTVPPGRQGSPDVTFADDEETAILLVQARDRPGLLATITSALTDAEARIVDSEIVTVAGRVRDRFQLTETDGAPISSSRRLDIARRVLAAIEQSDPRSTGA